MKTDIKAELLFWFQIVMAVVFAVPQCFQPFISTKGMPISWFLLFECFVLLNLTLSWGAYQINKDRATGQTFIIYLVWTVLIAANLATVSIMRSWTSTDTHLTIAVLTASLFTLVLAKNKGRAVSLKSIDPIVRGIIALLTKAVPQFYLGYCIMGEQGGDGLKESTVWAGHTTVLIRLALITIDGFKRGFNPHTRGMLIAELGNEVSWVFVTVIWYSFQGRA